MKKLKKRLTALENLGNIIPFHYEKDHRGNFHQCPLLLSPTVLGLFKGEIEDLQGMQKKAARLVTHSGLRTSRQNIYRQIGWMIVNQLV